MKELAKESIPTINNSEEEVTTTVVHLSEIVNISKHRMPLRDLFTVLLNLFMLENVKIVGVTQEEYFAATELGSEMDLDPNDALAVQVMDETGIDSIYSFDQNFDNIKGV
ncbi:MAG: type II toxin-antitoxin system VapC family toxin [Candidatus Heimdallarchaeota archaeon]